MAKYVTICPECGGDRVRVYDEMGGGCISDVCITCLKRGLGMAAAWIALFIATVFVCFN